MTLDVCNIMERSPQHGGTLPLKRVDDHGWHEDVGTLRQMGGGMTRVG